MFRSTLRFIPLLALLFAFSAVAKADSFQITFTGTGSGTGQVTTDGPPTFCASCFTGRRSLGTSTLCKHGLEGWIDAAIVLVTALHLGAGGGVGRDALGGADDGVASLIHTAPAFCADAGENCGAVRCAFFGFHGFHFVAVNVGLDLTPQWKNARHRRQVECVLREL